MEEVMYEAYQKLQEHEQECKYVRDMEIQRLHQELENSVPISLIEKKIEELETMYDGLSKNPKEHLHSKTEYKIVIGVLQELLDERNNTEVRRKK